MDRPRVLVTRPLFETALRLLEGGCDIEANPEERGWTKEELLARVREKHGIVCLLTDPIDSDVIAAGSELRVIANVAVGYDNIDMAAATRRGIAVTNTPGVLDETVADFAWALLLAAARRIVEGDQMVRRGEWQGWGLQVLLGSDVHGKTLGIVGLGRIGQAVARRARGFRMRILYYSLERAPAELESELGVEWRSFDALLADSDFVSLHVPLTRETHRLIGRAELERMRPGAILINTSRGPVVDESALADTLAGRRIAGAALDVFEREPTVDARLRELPNVVLAPHAASAAVETRTRMAMVAVENLLAALEGKCPPNLVNPEVWTERPE